jgi:hypothetical protein
VLIASNSPILLNTSFDSFSIAASAQESELLAELLIETTGVSDPDARIKKVNLARLSKGIDAPRRTKSNSPTRVHSIASRIELVQVTKYPADCHFRQSISVSGETMPTARIEVGDIVPSKLLVNMAVPSEVFDRQIALAAASESPGIPNGHRGNHLCAQKKRHNEFCECPLPTS